MGVDTEISLSNRISKYLSIIFFVIIFLNIFFYAIYDINNKVETRKSSSINVLHVLQAREFHSNELIYKKSLKDIVDLIKIPKYVTEVQVLKEDKIIFHFDGTGDRKIVSQEVLTKAKYTFLVSWGKADIYLIIVKYLIFGVIALILSIPILILVTTIVIKMAIAPLIHSVSSSTRLEDIDEKVLLRTPSEIKPLLSNIFLLHKKAQKFEIEQHRLGIASQVAHDIKSPLAALEVVMDDIKNLPEESRNLTLHAINRIQDIANNLTKDSQKVNGDISESECLISIVLASVVNEKTIEYQHNSNLCISLIDKTKKQEFCEIADSNFSRIISNLINNSVEAISGTGSVDLKLSTEGEMCLIEISDSGAGFPDQILNNPIESGRSFYKESGQGLGLFHAHKIIKSIGGNLEISNGDSKGAMVKISLPICISPKWFSNELKLNKFDTFIVVDDDKSIHDVWNKILEPAKVKVEHVFTEKEIMSSLSDLPNTTFVLLDYDLRHKRTGLQYIEHFNLKNVILVTSNFDSKDITDYCLEHEIKLIPKQIVSNVLLR